MESDISLCNRRLVKAALNILISALIATALLVQFVNRVEHAQDATDLLNQQRLAIEHIALLANRMSHTTGYEFWQVNTNELKEAVRHSASIAQQIRESNKQTLILEQTYLINTDGSKDPLLGLIDQYHVAARELIKAGHLRDELTLRRFNAIFYSDTPLLIVDNLGQAVFMQKDETQRHIAMIKFAIVITVVVLITVIFLSVQHAITPMYQSIRNQYSSSEAQRIRLENLQNKFKNQSQQRMKWLTEVSHQLRTPLTGIMGVAQLLKRGPLTGSQEWYVDEISNESNVLLQAIQNIMDFSHAEIEQLVIEKYDFVLMDVLDDVIDEAQQKANEKSLTFYAQLPVDLPERVIGDKARLFQVLHQILDNAIRFTQEGEVILHCRAEYCANNRVVFVVTVTDTGAGVAEGRIADVFKPFVRLDNNDIGGTGLGLTLVKNIIESMGGSVVFNSVEASGSTVCCRIPLETMKMPEHPVSLEQAKVQLSDLTALVVDDDTNMLNLISRVLERLQINVHKATTATAAFNLMTHEYEKGRDIDFVITDWAMPDSHGEAMAKKMRKYLVAMDVNLPKFVLISAFSADEAPSYERTIFSAVVKKPFGIDILVDTILSLVNLKLDRDHEELLDYGFIKGKALLLVEDNKVNQMIITQILERHGAEITHTSNGHDAITAVKENAFDMIIMDVQLPVMDGIEATKRIRQLPDQDDLVIVGLTAFTDDAIIQHCADVRMNNCLTKPIMEAQLMKGLADAFNNGNVPMQASAMEQTMRSKPVFFDEERLITQFSNEATMCKELINQFMSRYATLVKELDRMTHWQSWAELRHYLQSFRAIAEGLCLYRVCHSAQLIEDSLEQKDWINARRNVDELMPIWEETRQRLRHFGRNLQHYHG